jgi:hypothetical protein
MTAQLAKPNIAAKLVGWDDAAQDYRDVAVDGNGQVATTATVAADIQIGAVELKNDSDDTRAKVGAGGSTNGLRITVATDDAVVGALTETAPASDTASSGLNGRLQRIAQRLTTLIGSTLAVQAVRSGTATLANVAGSATSVTLIASNASRLGATIVNESTAICYVKFGSTASATSYTYLMSGASAAPYATLEVPYGYTGIITGIWASATGNARVTEMT